MDREKVIKGLKYCEEYFNCCDKCPYWDGGTHCTSDLAHDALTLLKEQEAVEPILDKQKGRIWLCGKCGSYVGFEDNDPHDPNEFDKYCRECGRPVLWKER